MHVISYVGWRILVSRCSKRQKRAYERLHISQSVFYIVENIYFDANIIQIGPVGQMIWEKVLFRYRQWRPSLKMAAILNLSWLTFFFKRVAPEDCSCKFWCLYHHLKDCPDICTYLPHYSVFDASRA